MQVLQCKKGRERALYNRHPWIFSGAVPKMPKVEDGDIVEIRDYEGVLYGYGFYAPGNQIVCRVFEYTHETIDVLSEDYWIEKIANAFKMRKDLVVSEHTNAYRLINAEGDFFPGVIADVYADTVVLQLLIKGTDRIKDMLIKGFAAIGFDKVYLKTKEVSKRIEETQTAKGWLTPAQGETKIPVLENGLRFYVDFEKGQKTGFFIDQRDSRQLLGSYSKDKNVLNTFSYSGGFSMYALQEGAALVHSVDSSSLAVDLCDENVALNDFDAEKHEGICEDCFSYLKKMDDNFYDVIVLDPPAFAKNARSVPNASRGYKELNLWAFRKVKPGGIVFTYSCSQKIERDLFRKIVFGAAADARRNVRILHQTTQPADHPINIYHPENEYLKGLVLQVE